MTRLLLAGVSTRAAAESAARAGFTVTALDAFADVDQHPDVRALSMARDFGVRFTSPAAARAARAIESDAVAYLVSDQAKFVTGVTFPVDAGFCNKL